MEYAKRIIASFAIAACWASGMALLSPTPIAVKRTIGEFLMLGLIVSYLWIRTYLEKSKKAERQDKDQ